MMMKSHVFQKVQQEMKEALLHQQKGLVCIQCVLAHMHIVYTCHPCDAMHACICAGNDAESETLQQNDVISISSTLSSSCEGIYMLL